MRKNDFPVFAEHPDLVYLDSAATSLRPRSVMQAVHQVMVEGAPVSRGLYPLSIAATEHYSQARKTIAHFIGAPEGSQVVFTGNATDSLNLVAHGLTVQIHPGDEILLASSEHHANLVPWQELAQRTGARLIFAEPNHQGQITAEAIGEKLTPKTRLLSVSLVSNVFGTLLPVAEIASLLQKTEEQQGRRPWLILDASQALAHLPLAQNLVADALVASFHKAYGPTGVGLLWGSEAFLNQLAPYKTGGGMIQTVARTHATWAPLPERLEAGSPNLEGVIGGAAAVTYLQELGWDKIQEHTTTMTSQLRAVIASCPEIEILGNPDPASGLVSFTHPKIHSHDLAQFLGDLEICVRAGHHCAQPLHQERGLAGSVRASVGVYTEAGDIEKLGQALGEAITFFGHA